MIIFFLQTNSLEAIAMSIYYFNGQEMKANDSEFNSAQMKAKIAAFDYDWTLVSPKDGKPFLQTWKIGNGSIQIFQMSLSATMKRGSVL